MSHICVMKNSPYFPSDAYMRRKSLYFSNRSRRRPTKQRQAKMSYGISRRCMPNRCKERVPGRWSDMRKQCLPNPSKTVSWYCETFGSLHAGAWLEVIDTTSGIGMQEHTMGSFIMIDWTSLFRHFWQSTIKASITIKHVYPSTISCTIAVK